MATLNEDLRANPTRESAGQDARLYGRRDARRHALGIWRRDAGSTLGTGTGHLTSAVGKRISESRSMHIPKETLETLSRLSTPTVSNAIELFNLRPRNEGYL